MKLVNYMLDHMLDYMLDLIIIGFLITIHEIFSKKQKPLYIINENFI